MERGEVGWQQGWRMAAGRRGVRLATQQAWRRTAERGGVNLTAGRGVEDDL